MEDKIYPLGSVVLLKGASKKLLIVGRALNVKNGEKTFFFDYGAVAYPEGLVGDEMAYFNQQDIHSVVFEGYSGEEDESYVVAIRDYLTNNPDIVKGSVETWESGD